MNSILKRIISALLTAAVFVLAIIYAPAWVITPAVAALALFAFVEYVLLLRKRCSLGSARAIPFLLLGLAVIGGGLSALPTIAIRHGNIMLLYVIAIVKFSDMGGFAIGMSTAKLMKGGNHKLCPSISPGKSWEGLFGSIFAACLLSCLFMSKTGFPCGKALAFGLVAAIVGTAGDLIESKYKRWIGVKDSATFMPAGLGGFLDMIDSLLLAPAVLLPFIP